MGGKQFRTTVLALAKLVDEGTVESVREDLDAGEWTVAVEWLADALFENEVSLPREYVTALVAIIRRSGSTRYEIDEIETLASST